MTLTTRFLTVALIIIPASAFAADPKADTPAHRALLEEHRTRAEPFGAIQGEVAALLAGARKCVPELIEKSFGSAPLPSAADCAPSDAPYEEMRKKLDACFANRYRELDNVIVRVKGIAAMASVRALGEGCAFNKELASFATRYDALENAMKPVRGEALVLMDKLGACSAEATRLLKVPPDAIEDRAVRRTFEERTMLLRRVAEVNVSLEVPEPVKAFTDCREALAFSRELLTRVGNIAIPGSSTTVKVKEPKPSLRVSPNKVGGAPRAVPASPSSADAMRRSMARLMALGAEITFAEEYVRQLGSFDLGTAVLAELQRQSGRCEALPQSLVEEATQKLMCYADALEAAVAGAKSGAKTAPIQKVAERFRAALAQE